MGKQYKLLFFLMFFLSGFCGLLYQIIWLRKAFAVFGVITPVISIVVSVFMLGLFIGSWLVGKWIKSVSWHYPAAPIFLYALAELLIGIGGPTVPFIFLWGDNFLLPIGAMGSATYLLLSALVIASSMLLWCICMGATYPLMMAYLKGYYQQDKTSFSFLYLANVIGAMTGTLITALFMIEMFGFRFSLFIAAGMNVLIAIAALLLGILNKSPQETVLPTDAPGMRSKKKAQQANTAGKTTIPARAGTILFITGFSSMGFEVVWTRAFTPILGTLIYSFAALLFVYLLATWLGSYFYRRHQKRGLVWSVPLLIAGLGIAAFLPIVLDDPRIPFINLTLLPSIFPFCALLGYLTPKLIDEYSQGDPEKAGRAYAINIAGCVLGPLFASYLLLPWGTKISLVCLALPILWLFIATCKGKISPIPGRTIFSLIIITLFFSSLFININFEEAYSKKGVIRHDHTATVVSHGEGMEKMLLVNGVGVTSLTPITKDMAHMPLLFLKHKPESALAICFGMGTTFRSLASWDIDVTAVELVPSVRDSFGYFHADAESIIAKSNVRIIVDDGRRYLRRTNKQFDIITIDPPPPIQAAGSSLLYSEEFYSLIKSRLKPGGIVQQWVPGIEEEDTIAAIIRPLVKSFNYVRMYKSIERWGFHFLASMDPIEAPSIRDVISRMPGKAIADRLEWEYGKSMPDIWDKLMSGEVNPTLYAHDPAISITDDRPYNEYYWLRERKVLKFLLSLL